MNKRDWPTARFSLHILMVSSANWIQRSAGNTQRQLWHSSICDRANIELAQHTELPCRNVYISARFACCTSHNALHAHSTLLRRVPACLSSSSHVHSPIICLVRTVHRQKLLVSGRLAATINKPVDLHRLCCCCACTAAVLWPAGRRGMRSRSGGRRRCLCGLRQRACHLQLRRCLLWPLSLALCRYSVGMSQTLHEEWCILSLLIGLGNLLQQCDWIYIP